MNLPFGLNQKPIRRYFGVMSAFDSLLISTIWELKHRGHWLESGTVQIQDELWSYKLQKLKKKPTKTFEKEGQP